MSVQCAGCPGKVRKGYGKRMLVASGHKSEVPKMGIVCPACVMRAVSIVIPAPTTIAPPCRGCKKHRATYCEVCMEGASRNVQPLSGVNAALVTERRRGA